MLITEGGPKGGRPVVEERVNVNHQGAGLDGAVRHVPGLNPGLKIPTTAIRRGLSGAPFQGAHLFSAMCGR